MNKKEYRNRRKSNELRNQITQKEFDAEELQRWINSVDSKSSVFDFVSLLRFRALTNPDSCAYRFISDGGIPEHTISYSQLDGRARVIATRLQGMGMENKRALLIYPAGIEYIVAFFGCLYAGVVAVPVYPPSRHHANRLRAIIHDASPSVVLSAENLREKLQENHEKDWNCKKLVWLSTDLLANDNPEAWLPFSVQPDNLAFLQYTSGSTGDPKGVMVSHGNLIANQRMIKQAFNHTQESVVVGWLPLYHDMGLIGNVLQPLYLGATAILMSPLTFLEQPIRWLRAISRYRATTSGGPNFAYELCVRKVTDEQKQELDLSCWTLAFNGAEPVRYATIERFSHAFSECGFNDAAFFPCYGLAESTLFVTGEKLHTKPSKHTGKNLSKRQNLPNATISSGHVWADHAVCIVNPETGIPCPDNDEGEIWVAGPSVAQGYWNRPEASESIFRAVLSLPEERLDLSNWNTRNIHQKYFDYHKYTFLRTGDLGITKQGNLFVTGRIKDLIILRGRNYYPHDFEQAIDDNVTKIRPNSCAAFSVEHEGEERLVVAVEVKRKKISNQEADEIFSTIRETLAEASDVSIGEILLLAPGSILKTSSGKIQRQAIKKAYLNNGLNILARMGGKQSCYLSAPHHITRENSYINLSRETLLALPNDERLQLIMHFLQSQVAKLSMIPETNLSPAHSIRRLGLDSLRLVELKHVVDTLLDSELSLTLFLSEITIAELAEKLIRELSEPRFDKEIYPLQKENQKLSCAQQSIWAVHQLEPNSIIYNLHLSLYFHGALDNALLHRALEKLLQRHSQLRTCYRIDGGSVQQNVIPCNELSDYFSTVDASEWTESALQSDLTRRLCEPFDLSSGLLLRVISYQLSQHIHIVLFCAHHVAVDLWTSMVLLEDLSALLQNLKHDKHFDLPQLTANYQDFVTWQQHYLNSKSCQDDRIYWQNKLEGSLPVLELFTDFPRPLTSAYRGASHTLRLNRDLTDKLKQLGQKYDATLFMTLLAVYKVLLHRYTHQDDIIVGTACNGRPQSRFKRVAGYFVNPVALRTHPSALLSFASYLMQVRDTVIEALSHADYPFSLLVEQLQPERSANHWPIYQTLLILQQSPAGMDETLAHFSLGEEGTDVTWGDWKVSSKEIKEQVENFDIRLMAAEDDHGLLLSFKYRADLFEAATIGRMAGHLQMLLEQVITNPDCCLRELSMLTQAECMQQLCVWNPSFTAVNEKRCLHELFETQVIQTPMKVAVVCNGERLTYAELNKRANRLAHYLRLQAVGPEIVVGLCIRRSLDMVVGILGILKSGGAYVPIDPDFPRERIKSLLNDSGAAFIVTQQVLVDRVQACNIPFVCLDSENEITRMESNDNPRNACLSDHLAYIIYTSGSTGKSKGVAISHGNVVHSTQARFKTYPDPIEGFLLLSSYTFDSSIAGIFWTLCQGGCLHIPADGMEKDPHLLGKILATEKVSHLLCLPLFYSLLLETLPLFVFDEMKVVIVAGEVCSSDLVAKHYLKLPHVSLFNEYGPTEGTVWSSVYPIQADEFYTCVLIGKPIQNVQIYLLDRDLNPVPTGVSGEIYIGGKGLARGYQRAPDLTAAQFIPNIFASNKEKVQSTTSIDGILEGSRLYRTGDLARYRPDGSIEFLGRIDHQVKIRGFRIELGEIEAKLQQHLGVKEAVVLVHENFSRDKRLIAYLSVDSAQFLDHVRFPSTGFDSNLLTKDLLACLSGSDKGVAGNFLCNQYLQQFLKKSLPDFMVPSVFIFMKKLPRLPNGKLNRTSFPMIENISPAITYNLVEPTNSIEKSIREIWKVVLNIEHPLGIHDNFFDLGGHSMSAIRVMVWIQNEFNIILPVAKIFEAPTISQLAYLVAQLQIEGQDQTLIESLLDELEQLPDETGFIDDREIASARWSHE